MSMKIKIAKKILALAIAGSLLTVFSASVLAENEKRLSLSEIKEFNINENFQFPFINEIYGNAINAKITADWISKIEIKNKNYKSMSLPKRAFEVGKTLSDISFLVLNTEKSPSKAIQNSAFSALSSISLSEEFKSELNKLKNSGSSLKGEKLRKTMDHLIEVLLRSQESENTTVRDTTIMLLAASYFKAYYLAAETVKNYPNPTKEQLEFFSWKYLKGYLIYYFENKASQEYKNNTVLKGFLLGLKKIKPISDKPHDKITKEDVIIISKTLRRFFN